jgi:hypothetical protein
MKTNAFGEYITESAADIRQAMEEGLIVSNDCYALISEEPREGWYAEIMDNDTGDTMFSTVVRSDKAALIAELKEGGITDIQESS